MIQVLSEKPMRVFTRKEIALVLRVAASGGADMETAKRSLKSWQREARRQRRRELKTVTK